MAGVIVVMAALTLSSHAQAQRVAILLADAPVYLRPDFRQRPAMTIGSGSTATLVDIDGLWCRISFQDRKGRTRSGFVPMTFIKLAEAPDGTSAPAPPPPNPKKQKRKGAAKPPAYSSG